MTILYCTRTQMNIYALIVISESQGRSIDPMNVSECICAPILTSTIQPPGLPFYNKVQH